MCNLPGNCGLRITLLIFTISSVVTAMVLAGCRKQQYGELERMLGNAAERGNINEVREALESGAKIDVMDLGGSTALMRASGVGNEEVVELLLTHGADPNLCHPRKGFTALQEAARYRYAGIVELLIAAGADLDMTDRHGHTALMLAARRESNEIVRMLLEAGAQRDIRDNEGRLAIDFARGDSSIESLLQE